MKPLYSAADVERWVTQNAKKRQILERRLGTNWRDATDVQGLSMLSLSLEDEGYTAIALGKRDEAIRNFREAVLVEIKILKMARMGVTGATGYLVTGCFQILLNALAIGDDSLTAQFVGVFEVDGIAAQASPPDSTYIARVLKALAQGKQEDAKHVLATPPPDVDPQFSGYVECLQAIAEKRFNEFEEELCRAARAWERFVRKDSPGHPLSVCFMGGLGLLRLAEKVWQRQLEVKVEQLPQLLV
ncbi:MAG: hypothetical protein ACO1RA_03390 [Planctomycetaceae bacterium]